MTTMLVTRPLPEASETAARLSAIGIAPVVAPLMDFAVIPAALPPADECGGMVVTSANALRALDEMGVVTAYRHLRLFAVGDRTAKAARDLGFADTVSASGNAEDLIALLRDRAPQSKLFYPAARHLAHDLAALLAPSGIVVDTVPVYDMRPAPSLPDDVAKALGDGAISAALFYSRRAAETFVALADAQDLALGGQLAALCLSANVAAPLLASGYARISLADFPSEEAMIALALSFARDQIGS